MQHLFTWQALIQYPFLPTLGGASRSAQKGFRQVHDRFRHDQTRSGARFGFLGPETLAPLTEQLPLESSEVPVELLDVRLQFLDMRLQVLNVLLQVIDMLFQVFNPRRLPTDDVMTRGYRIR